MKQTEISKSRGWWKHLLLLGVTLLGVIGFATAAPNYPFPNNYAYPYGKIYTGSDVKGKIQTLYEEWKDNYYETSGKYGRVKFTQKGESGDNSVSEGIAYGMLIFVYMDNATNNTQADFDRLWEYYKLNMNDNGVMNWKVSKFTGQVTAGDGNANGATDADLDAAQALLMAYKQWGDSKYLNDAKTLISNIWTFEVNHSNNSLKPGDMFDDYKNPCYFITNAMRLFDYVNTMERWGKAWDWAAVVSNCYSTMKKAANATTGLIPDWCYNDGSYLNGLINFKFESIFGYDAVRIPWRMAHAYAWYGDDEAKAIASKITNWASTNASTKEVTNIVDGYYLNGTPGDGQPPFTGSLTSWGSSSNACFKGGLSIGSMVDASFNSYMTKCWTYGAQTDAYGAYYTHTTQLLFMLCLTGNMPNFYDMNPVFVNAETDAVGSSIIVNFSKPISSSSLTSSLSKIVVTTYPTAEDATNKTNGSTISVSSASVSSKEVTLNMVEDISNPYIYISYSGTSLKGEDASIVSEFTDQKVTNKITSMEPYPIARYTDVLGTKVFIQWSKEVKLSTASASDFTVYVNGTAVTTSPTLDYVTDEGIIDKTTLALTWSESILSSTSDVVTISYTAAKLTGLTGAKTAKAFTKAVVQNFYMSESCLDMYVKNAETSVWTCNESNIPVETDFASSSTGVALHFTGAGNYQRLIYTPTSEQKAEWNTNLADPNSRLVGRFYLKSMASGADAIAITLWSGKTGDEMGYLDNNAVFILDDMEVGSWYDFDIPLSTPADMSWQAYSENQSYSKLYISPMKGTSEAGTAFEIYIENFSICPKPQTVIAESGKVLYDGSQVELHFSTAMKVPTSLSAITIKEGSTSHAVTSIETKTGDASTLIFNLETPITSSSVAITASLAAETSDVKSNDGRKSAPFSITLANLIGCTTSTGWYDDFADANDYVTANLNIGTFDDDVNYSIIENAKNSVLEFTQDGSDSWGSQIILAPYSEATNEGYVLDLSGDRGVIKFNVKADAVATVYYRIDVKDYFGNKKDGTFTKLILKTTGTEITYNPSFSGVDPTAISEIQFRFIKNEGSEKNDYVPTLYKGTLYFDYISVGQPLYLSDFSPAAVLDTKSGIDEDSNFKVTSSSDGYVFVVRGDVNPQYSAMMAAVNAGEGTYTACTANTPATIDMTGLGYGYFKAYAYDPVSGSISSAYGCQVKDVTPPHFTEYFNEPYIDADGTLFFTVDEDATVYLMPCDVEKTEISNTVWQWIVEGGKPTVYDMTTMYEGKLIKPGDKFYLVAADGSGNYSDVVPEYCYEINQVALNFSVDAAEYTIGETMIVEASRPSKVYLIPSTESIKKIDQLDKKNVLSAVTNQYGLCQISTDELIIEDTTTYYIYVADTVAGEFVGPSSLITIVPATYTLNKITLDQGAVQVRAGCEAAEVQVTFDEARYPNQKLKFSGDYADYVTITYDETANAQGKGTILLEGLKAGEPTITVTCDADETKTATFTAQVVEVPTGITVDGITDDKLTLSVGETKTLSAAILPASSAQDVLWSTTDKSIVDVTGSTIGAIKAVAKGTTTLTVRSKGTGCDGYVTKDITVTVKEAGLTSIAVWGGDGALCKDDAVSEYTIDFESGDWDWIDPDDEDANYTTFAVSYSPTSFTSFSGVTVSSSNTDVATVTTPEKQNGFKTFGCSGSANVYVFDVNFLDLDGDCAITVTAKDDPSITATIIIGNPPCNTPKPTNAKATPASPTTCDEVTLSATGTGTLTWYEGDTKLSSANLGTLTAGAHTYYVTNTTTCESEKVAVNVTVSAVAAPTATEAPAIEATTDDEVVLKATLSSGTAAWYTTATGGTALTSTNVGTLTAGEHTYYVARILNGCESERTAVKVTITQAACKTAAPTATEVPDVTICEGTDATLKATFSGTATAVWYAAATGGTSLYEGNTWTTGDTEVGPHTYYVAKMDGCESEARTEVSVSITAKPTAVIASTIGDEYCATVESVALGATPATGTWSGKGVTGTTFSPKTAGAGNVTLTYTIGTTGCQNTYTKDITVTAAPTVTVTVPEKMCSSDAAATLSATPATGTWSGTGVTGTSFDPSKGTAVVTYTYTEGACEVVKESTITVGTTPSPKISGLDASYCSNAAAVTMTAAPTGGSFKVNGSAATTFDPAAAIVGANTVTYTVTVDGCEGSVDAPVTVVAAPSIDLSGVETNACAGQEVTLAPTTGKWTGTGVTGTTFVSSTADTYELTYTEEANGCSASDNVAITVTKATAPIVNPGIVEIGSTATPLTATGSGTINWYETQTGASIATGATYTPTVSTATKATFTFYVSNTEGSCESEKVPVTFTVTDCMTPAPTIADYTELCEGETATLSATGSNIKWYTEAVDGDVINEGATLEVTTAGTYYASQDVTGCESARASVVVTFKSKPAAPTATGASSCAGAELVAMTTVESANWYASQTGAALATATKEYKPASISETTTFYVNQTVSGCTSEFAEVIYTVKATPEAPAVTPAKACLGTEADYKVSATGTDLQWYDSNNSPLGTASEQAVSGVTTAKDYSYSVTQTVDGCESPAATATLTVNALPTPTITLDAEYCDASETEVMLAATPNGGKFTINGEEKSSFVPKALGDGDYTVTYSYTDENGCTGKATDVTFTVKDCSDPAVTSITLNKTSLTLTEGDTYNAFTVTILPTEGIYNKTYAWKSDNESVATVNASTGEVTAVKAGSAVITVYSTYTEGKEATCNVTVEEKIIPVESVSFAAGVPTTVDEYGSVDLSSFVTINPEDASHPEITWTVSGTAATIEDGVLTAGKVSADTKVTVTVEVKAGDVTKKATTQITIIRGPVAVETITVTAPKSAQENGTFTAKATVAPSDANDKTFTWSIEGTGATISTTGVVTITGVSGDSFDVVATANDGSGVVGKATVTVVDQIFPVESVTFMEGVDYTIFASSGSIDLSDYIIIEPANASVQSIEWSLTSSSYAIIDATTGVISGNKTTLTSNKTVTAQATVTYLKADGNTATIKEPVKVTIKKDPIMVSQIQVAKTLQLEEEATYTMTAVVTPTNADNKTITWSVIGDGGSIDPTTGVLTITGSEGEEFIVVATANDEDAVVSNECVVTILQKQVPVIAINVLVSEVEVTAGQDEAVIEVTYEPSNTTQKDFVLIAGSTNFSYVDNEDGTITITGNQGGTGTLTIKSVSNPSVMQVVEVKVTELVKNITVSGKATLNVGNTTQMTANVGELTATNKTVTWASSDESIATVSATGLVTAKSSGMVQIIATATDGSEVSGYTYITINTIPVEKITVSPVTLEIGQTAQIKATITPTNATYKDLVFEVVDNSIISVDAAGNITTFAIGSTEVVVSAPKDNISQKIVVEVTPNKADKEYLIRLIEDEVWGAYSVFYKVESGEYVVGVSKGQISPLVYNEFQDAWMAAQDVRYETFATQEQVDEAANRLYKAIVAMGADPDPDPSAVEDIQIEVKVYPTVVTNEVTIEATNLKSIKVYSLTGKLVANEQVDADELTIETTKLSQGVYRVVIETEEGQASGSFIKK